MVLDQLVRWMTDLFTCAMCAVNRKQGAFEQLDLHEFKMINSKKSRTEAPDMEAYRVAFLKHARPADQMMDREEYLSFAQSLGLDEKQASEFWVSADSDGNGVVDADEFTHALHKLFKKGAPLRYCPTCGHTAMCGYCLEVQACPMCTTGAFCSKCWQNHPENPDNPKSYSLWQSNKWPGGKSDFDSFTVRGPTYTKPSLVPGASRNLSRPRSFTRS